MNDIASSLEQEFTTHAQAGHEAHIAELRKIEAAGRGSADVAAHAIALPLLFGSCGLIVIYSTLTAKQFSAAETVGFLLLGILLASTFWLMLGPRKPCYTLCEEGVRVKGGLLPWSSIEDWTVSEISYGGFPIATSLVLIHGEGVKPPPLGLLVTIGSSHLIRKTGRYETRLTLYTGARGMNTEKLTERIGGFFAAYHARLELVRMG